MKQLSRLEISAWYPVMVEEAEAATMTVPQLHALYEHCEVNPYDFDDLKLRLTRATRHDIAKYGDTEDENTTDVPD